MDLNQIKDLMRAMGRHNIHRLELEKEDCSLVLEHGSSQTIESVPQHIVASAPVQQQVLPTVQHALPPQAPLPASTEEKPKVEEGVFIPSPMVGTFYNSPSPDDPPFVKVGDRVNEGDVICIIEAMKVMNEVKAGVSGTIAEALVDNAHPVEFGSKLFRVVP